LLMLKCLQQLPITCMSVYCLCPRLPYQLSYQLSYQLPNQLSYLLSYHSTVAACLVLNVWSGMSRNLLFMLNCVAIIITQKLNSDVELQVFSSSHWPPSISI